MKKKTKPKLIRWPIFLLLVSFIFLTITLLTLRQRITLSSQAKNRIQNAPTPQLRPDLCDLKGNNIYINEDTYQYVGFYGPENCYLFQVSYKNNEVQIFNDKNDQTKAMAWDYGPGYDYVRSDDYVISKLFETLIPIRSTDLLYFLQNNIFPKIIHVVFPDEICTHLSSPNMNAGGCFVNNHVILPIYFTHTFESELTTAHEILHAINKQFSKTATYYYLKDTDQCVVFDPNYNFLFSYYSNDNNGNIIRTGIKYGGEFLPTLGEVIYYIRQYGSEENTNELSNIFFAYFNLLPIDEKTKYLQLALGLEKKLMNNGSNFSIFEPTNYRSSQLGKTLLFLGNDDATVGFNLIKDFSASLVPSSNIPQPPWPTVTANSVKEICESGLKFSRNELRKAK